MKKRLYIYLLVSAIGFYSCSFAPKYSKPQVNLPPDLAKTACDTAINTKWWQNYKDENLNMLIEEALKNNDDLKLAATRIEEARYRLGFAKADRFPFINANAAASRQRTSAEASQLGSAYTNNYFSLSADVAYELDLWGKLKNRKEAAYSTLLSTKAGKDTLQLSLVSNVATVYFNLVSLARQLQTTENILTSYKEIYEFRQKQFKHGILDEMVVQQAKAQYDSVKILLENLKEQDALLKNTLSLILGKTPNEIFDNLYNINLQLPEPIKVPALLPSKLLENRPDILQAEETLKAANFQIGVAKAAYFPSISLTGALGLHSFELDNLMQSSARMWNIGGNLIEPVLDFGRRNSNVKITEAQQKQAVIQYVKTVKTAFKEVHDALIKIKTSGNKLSAQEEELKALERVLFLANKKYEVGVVDYLTVLDAQRGYLNSSLNLISYQTEVINSQIVLYKALGGGWTKALLSKNDSI
ncbi:MAG: efflux transporter outer membrane subunit [Proteobacteria bacterium]|nr:efflux transporter outer membrane subunit [Pseudomonadota bacterium]